MSDLPDGYDQWLTTPPSDGVPVETRVFTVTLSCREGEAPDANLVAHWLKYAIVEEGDTTIVVVDVKEIME